MESNKWLLLQYWHIGCCISVRFWVKRGKTASFFPDFASFCTQQLKIWRTKFIKAYFFRIVKNQNDFRIFSLFLLFCFFLPVNLLLHIICNISHPQYFQKCSVLCILSPPIIQYPYNTVLNKAFKSCVTIPSMQFDLNSFLQKSVFASFIVGLYSQIFYKTQLWYP